MNADCYGIHDGAPRASSRCIPTTAAPDMDAVEAVDTVDTGHLHAAGGAMERKKASRHRKTYASTMISNTYCMQSCTAWLSTRGKVNVSQKQLCLCFFPQAFYAYHPHVNMYMYHILLYHIIAYHIILYYVVLYCTGLVCFVLKCIRLDNILLNFSYMTSLILHALKSYHITYLHHIVLYYPKNDAIYSISWAKRVGRRASSVVRCRPAESVKDTDELTRSLGAAPPGLVEALAQVGGIVLGQLSCDILIYFSIDILLFFCMICLLIHLFFFRLKSVACFWENRVTVDSWQKNEVWD